MISPRTQAMVEQQSASPQDMFESGFRDMALQQLMAKHPDLASQVATFKILKASPEENLASGTFIIQTEVDEIHVPAVFAENKLMPFDLMYVRSRDQFLPLTDDWITQVDSNAIAQMGSTVEVPETLSSDQDIRNVVVPPTTGRYSYASAGGRGRFLPTYLKYASDASKRTFLRTMERYPKIAQYAFSIYDKEDLADALRPSRPKHAAASASPNVLFATIETPTRVTRAVFGSNAPAAMQDIAQKGYAVADNRETTSALVPKEGPLTLQVPSETGFYRVFRTDGETPSSAVFCNVVRFEDLIFEGHRARSYGKRPTGDRLAPATRLVLSADRKVCLTEQPFVAESLPPEDVPNELRTILAAALPGTPRNGQRGFFVDTSRTKGYQALEPVKIEFVTVRDGVRYIEACTYSGDHVQITQIEKSPIKQIKAFSGVGRDFAEPGAHGSFLTQEEHRDAGYGRGGHVSVILVPWHYKFVPIEEVIDVKKLLKDPMTAMALYYRALEETGAARVRLKNAGYDQVSVGNDVLSRAEAVKRLTIDYNLRVKQAEFAVNSAAATSTAKDFYVVSSNTARAYAKRLKAAQEGYVEEDPAVMAEDPYAMQDPAMMAEDPYAMQDPAMMAEDPYAMQDHAMMAPPEPDPIELAAQEIMQQLQYSAAEVQNQLMMQQQSLQTQQAAIEAVVQRAQQIEMERQGIDAGPPIGAPPVDMPPPPVAGDPAQAMGAPTPGAGGMAPAEGAAYPGAGMPVEEPAAMEQALELQDPELFDAAAIASIANQNAFDQSVTTFMPVFEETLDALGRLLMELRVKATELVERMGGAEYDQLVDGVETLFKTMGETVINLQRVVVGDVAY